MNECDGPIVTAVRQARARIASACNHDFQQLADRLRKIEAAHGDRVARPKRKRGVATRARTQP